jgi:hypothetical protein
MLLDYVLALAGWLLYNFFLFTTHKDITDAQDKDFDYKAYAHKNWDNWLFTFLLAPVLVYFIVDIVDILANLFNTEIVFYEIYYLGCGVLTELIYIGIERLRNLKNKLK